MIENPDLSNELNSQFFDNLWAILRHIVNHSTYHRGQIASKLKQFGIEQPNTDFFWWTIEQIPQEA